MFRLLIACSALALVINGSDVQAQGYGSGNGYGFGAGWGYPRGTTGYRFGYLYDPYASGSFRAPDLMDDPSFRAKLQVGNLFQPRHSNEPSRHSYRSAPAPHHYHYHHPQPVYSVPLHHGH